MHREPNFPADISVHRVFLILPLKSIVKHSCPSFKTPAIRIRPPGLMCVCASGTNAVMKLIAYISSDIGNPLHGMSIKMKARIHYRQGA